MTDAARATANKVVSIRYTLHDGNGQTLESTGSEAMEYLHGHENIVPGLEQELEGKGVGARLDVVVPPEQAYGPRRQDARRTVPRQAFPDDLEPEPGMQLATTTPDGETIPLWVVEAGKEEVVIDLDHPLAGESLRFEVEVMGIRDATEEEIAHGHVHGPGGHHHH